MSLLFMEPTSRHQCLIYDGAPSLHLPALARVIRAKLRENYRCLYLNSPTMVAGMQSYLAAEGVEVGKEIARGSLVVSAEREHLVDGIFDVNGMVRMLEQTLAQALRDGFAGLWATGDMSWEMGGENNLTKLLEYERRLENFLEAHAEMGGVCQYRIDTLPAEAVRDGQMTHRSMFINETLSILNEHYAPPHPRMRAAWQPPQRQNALRH
ncbi:MAG TPA: MEDS domain-containing protein [Acidobacteriaceae bacterium]|nr:MEDS domain-containing protein [Acidobacteriaceae bacterium]